MITSYHRPETIVEALELLKRTNTLPLGGGTLLSSLKSAKQRHRDCKVVRRRGKVFVICKSNPRFKARQR